MEYEEKFNELKKYAQMKTEEDVRLFDLTVYELAGTKDLGVLEKLIDVFDDNCEFHEVMYSLVHAIETYPMETYVINVLNKLDYGLKHYPMWVDCLVNRIFNDTRYREYFIRNMYLVPKDTLKELFRVMEKESVHHIPLIKKLHKQLESN